MILKKDNSFVICLKPAGISSQSLPDGKDCMPKRLADCLEIPQENIYTLHRLDNPVGGTMVYATTKKGAAVLSGYIADGTMQKTYLAVIRGVPENKEGVYEDLLFKDSTKNKSFVVKRMRKGVRKASLEYKVLGTLTHEDEQYSLVQILLHTGRTHQIRVQFSSRKLPLAGDRRYGSGNDGMPLGLWCMTLAFPDPSSNGDIVSMSATPSTEQYPWCLFKEIIPQINT